MPTPCPSCNKFCRLELQEPEIDNLEISEVDDNGTVYISSTIRIVRNSECCGDEMKEYTFDNEFAVTVVGHRGKKCELSIDDGSIDAFEESGSRYAKNFYGFSWTPEVTCLCGKPVEFEEGLDFTDKVQASYMDEIC